MIVACQKKILDTLQGMNFHARSIKISKKKRKHGIKYLVAIIIVLSRINRNRYNQIRYNQNREII